MIGGEVDSAIGAAILNAKTKIDDLKSISEQIPDEPREFEDSTGSTPEKTRRGRRLTVDDGSAKTKTISVHLSLADIKKLRLIALSNERALKDEVADMIRERYKVMAKNILSEDD